MLKKIKNFINKYNAKYLTEDINEKFMYLFFGGLTTLVNIVTYRIGTSFFGIDYITSSIIAWIVSVIFAFLTNKYFVFKSKNDNLISIIKEIFSFFIFRVLSLLLDLGTMFLFVGIVKINDLYAKIIANVLVVLANYFASKLIIFKNNLIGSEINEKAR